MERGGACLGRGEAGRGEVKARPAAERVAVFAPFHEPSMAVLSTRYDVVPIGGGASRMQVLAELADSVRIAVCNGQIGMSRAEMAALHRLELIACYGVGYDGIDVAAARQAGIAVTNTPRVLDECVADLAMGLVIDVIRKVSLADRFSRAGRWLDQPFPLTDHVHGKTMGILGLGNIGKAIARRAEAFRMPVCYAGRHHQPVRHAYYPDVETLAAASDVLVVAVPGGAATRALVDQPVLDALGPRGYLVNVSRGSVVDEPALVRALEQGRIAGAALDVFEDEPHIPESLRRMDSVVLQPHVASGTEFTRAAMGTLLLDNVQAFVEGRALVSPVLA